MQKIGLIGCGYWGKNYVRTIGNMPDLELKCIVDISQPKISIPKTVEFSQDLNYALQKEDINGFIIATPAETHYDVASKIISAGKNVLIEKPLTKSSSDAERLCEQAEKKGVTIMVGHIFKYNEAIIYAKNKLDSGDLGELRYIESRRVGLGPIRKDASVLWDLATHDIYIATYITKQTPLSVNCSGKSHNRKVDDIISLNLQFPKDVFVSIYANWEHPKKERITTIGGSEKAVVFDDIEPSDKIKVYERSVNFTAESSADFGEFKAFTREGDVHIPKIRIGQPLENEINHFVDCIERKTKCLSDGLEGLSIVKILEAAEESRRNSGREIQIK